MNAITKVLVPVDFSENASKILKDAVSIAAKFGAALHVIYVVQSFDDYSGFFVPHMPIAKFEEEMLQGAEKKMEQFLEENLPAGTPRTAKVLVGDVSEVIIDFAADEGMGLIIMGTHGYKGLERILFGSVAEKIVKNAPCPVLTINPYK